MKRSHLVLASVVASTALLLAGCAGGAATSSTTSTADANCSQPGTTGVTASTIKIGNSSPLSGPAAFLGSYSIGQQAFYNMVNSRGGIVGADGKKRKVEFTALDDGYDPSKTRTNADVLINQDKVFAMVGTLGTPTTLAARPVTEAACAPDLFALSGDPAVSDPTHPNTIGLAIISTVEGNVFAQYLRKNDPTAKVAILSLNTEYSTPYLEGFMNGIKGSKITVVAKQTYEATDTDVRQQITTLAASGADVLYDVALSATAMQAMNNAASAGWQPTILLPSGTALDLSQLKKLNPGAGKNAIIGSYVKVPGDPAFADDTAVKQFLTWWNKAPGSDKYPASSGVPGWLAAQLFAQSFETAKSVDRAAVLDAAHNLTLKGDTLVRTGINIQSKSPHDTFMVEGEELQQYDPTTQALKDLGVVDTNGKNQK